MNASRGETRVELRALLLLAGLTALLGLGCGAFARRGPNVLVLVMDTTRADRCSFLGYGRPTTPHLEELAASSVIFTDAWSPASWTFPAHSALFTGRRPDRLGVIGRVRRPLRSEVPTLASVLSADGWETGCFTCSSWITPASGLARGFGTLESVYDVSTPGPASEAHRRALAWMQTQHGAGRRFFAFINDMEPHACWEPPASVAAHFVDPAIAAPAVAEARTLCVPRTVKVGLGLEKLPADVMRAASDLYDGEIATLDAELGRLFAGMREQGLLDDTLIVVVGDHGEGLGDHGWLEHCAFLHRELLHVPLLVRPPGGVPRRSVTDVVRLEDVFPTVLEVCGVQPPGAIDGASLLGDTAGRTAIAAERVPDDHCTFMDEAGLAKAAAQFRAGRRSIYDGTYHLLVAAGDHVELYDVRSDPREETNLAARLPDVAAELRARLESAQ